MTPEFTVLLLDEIRALTDAVKGVSTVLILWAIVHTLFKD